MGGGQRQYTGIEVDTILRGGRATFSEVKELGARSYKERNEIHTVVRSWYHKGGSR